MAGRADARARRLMTVPGVGSLVALTFTAAVDDPTRFRSSRQVGAHFGLTPSRYQSGETDVTGISKIGDHGARTALYEAANVILTRPAKGSALKDWAHAIAKAQRAEKGEGRARAQARRHPTPHAHRRPRLQAPAGDGDGCGNVTKEE